MSTQVLPSKIVAEDLTVQFDFISQLAIGETITSSAVTATVFNGTDASPSSIVSGVASASGTIVSQDIIDGLPGVIYLLACAVTTSLGNNIIILGRLAVLSTRPF